MCIENLAHDAQPRQRPDQGELDQGNRRGGPDPGGMSCGKNRKAQGRGKPREGEMRLWAGP